MNLQSENRPRVKVQHSLSQNGTMKKAKNRRGIDSLAACFRVQRSTSISGLELDDGLQELALEKLSFQPPNDFQQPIGLNRDFETNEASHRSNCEENEKSSKESSRDATDVNKLSSQMSAGRDWPSCDKCDLQGDHISDSLNDAVKEMSDSQVQGLLIEGEDGAAAEDVKDVTEEESKEKTDGCRAEQAENRLEGGAEDRSTDVLNGRQAVYSGSDEATTEHSEAKSLARLSAFCAANESESDKRSAAKEAKETRKAKNKSSSKRKKEESSKAGESPASAVSGSSDKPPGSAGDSHSVAARINLDKSESEFDWNAAAAQHSSLPVCGEKIKSENRLNLKTTSSRDLKSLNKSKSANDLETSVTRSEQLKRSSKSSCNSFVSPFSSTLSCSKAFASSLSSSLKVGRVRQSLGRKSTSASQLSDVKKVSKVSKVKKPTDQRSIEKIPVTYPDTAQLTQLTTESDSAPSTAKTAPKAVTLQRLATVPNRLKRFARGFSKSRIRESFSEQSKSCIEQLLQHEQCKRSAAAANSPDAKNEPKMKLKRNEQADHQEHNLIKTLRLIDYKDLTLMQILALKPIRSKLKSIAENKSLNEQSRSAEQKKASERSEKQITSESKLESKSEQTIGSRTEKRQQTDHHKMVLPEMQTSPVCGENAPPAADFEAIYTKKSCFASKFIAANESFMGNCKGSILSDLEQDVLKSIGELNKLNQRANQFEKCNNRSDRTDSQYDKRNPYAQNPSASPDQCENRKCNQPRCECVALLKETDENSKQSPLSPNQSEISSKSKQWIQLAGHEQSFYSSNKPGTILKKNEANESTAYRLLNDTDDQIVEFIPKFYSVISTDDGQFIELQDLLTLFDNPCCMMDVKMGSRTFLEQDVSNSRSRPDLYEKLIKIDSNAATQEEHKQKAITKLRWVTLRDRLFLIDKLVFKWKWCFSTGTSQSPFKLVSWAVQTVFSLFHGCNRCLPLGTRWLEMFSQRRFFGPAES